MAIDFSDLGGAVLDSSSSNPVPNGIDFSDLGGTKLDSFRKRKKPSGATGSFKVGFMDSTVNLVEKYGKQSIEYLDKVGGSVEKYLIENDIVYPSDLLLFHGALKGLTGHDFELQPETLEALNVKEPSEELAYMAGEMAGGLSLIVGVGAVAGTKKIATTIGSSLYKYPKLSRFLTPAATWGTAVGGADAVREGIRQVEEGDLDLEKFGKLVSQSVATGAGGGLTQGFSRGLVRVAGGSAFGYGTTIAHGGSHTDATINAAIMAAFSAISSKEISEAQKRGAIRAGLKNVYESAKSDALGKGYSAEQSEMWGGVVSGNTKRWIESKGGIKNFDLKSLEKAPSEIVGEIKKVLGELPVTSGGTPKMKPEQLPGSRAEPPISAAPVSGKVQGIGKNPISRVEIMESGESLPIVSPKLKGEIQSKVEKSNLTDVDILRTWFVDPLTELPDAGLYHSWKTKEGNKRIPEIPQVMMDIDNFKKVNDTWGHEVGDVVLQEVGYLLKKHGFDAIRRGGEEFSIPFFESSDPIQVAKRFKELQKELKTKRFFDPDTGELLFEGVTVSAGFGINAREADSRLYAAKHRGKDQILIDRAQVIEYSKSGGLDYELTGPEVTDVDPRELGKDVSRQTKAEGRSIESGRIEGPVAPVTPSRKALPQKTVTPEYPPSSLLGELIPKKETREEIVSFIIRNGGINPKKAESSDIRELEMLNILNTKKGKSLDDMRSLLAEAGYLPRESVGSDVVELLRDRAITKKKKFPLTEDFEYVRPVDSLDLAQTERALIELEAFAAGRGQMSSAEKKIYSDLVEHRERLTEDIEYAKFDEETKGIIEEYQKLETEPGADVGQEQLLIPGTPKRTMPKTPAGPKVPQVEDRNLLEEFRPDTQTEFGDTVRVPSGVQASGSRGNMKRFETIEAPQPAKEFKLAVENKKIFDKYRVIVGEGYTSGMGGLHFPDTGNVMVNALNDISVSIHELFHNLDNKHGILRKLYTPIGVTVSGKPKYDSRWRQIRKELTDVYVKFYPGKKTHKLERRVVEGGATFIERFTTHPKETQEAYPRLVAEFLKSKGRFYKQSVSDMVKDYQSLISKYQSLNDLEKVSSRTTMTFKQGSIQGGFFSYLDRVIEHVVDAVHPIEKLAKLSGSARTGDDPSLWVRHYSNSSALILNNIKGKSGFWTIKKDGNMEKVSDKSIKDLTDMLQKTGSTEDFNSVLVARNQHFQYERLDKLKDQAIHASKELKKLTELEELTPQMKERIPELNGIIESHQRLESVLAKDAFDRNVVSKAYDQHKDRFVKELALYDTFTKANLGILRESGLITSEQYREMVTAEGYASMKRDVYNAILGEGEESLPSGRSGASRVSSLIGRRGSQLDIVAPLASLMRDHAEIMRKSMKQIVLNKVYGISGEFPELFQKVPLERHYNPVTKVTKYPQEKDPNILMARGEGGTRIPLLVAREIKEVLDGLLDFKNVHIFEVLLRKSSSIFTKGTTGAYPLFAPVNFLLDQITATAQTRHKFIPLYDPISQISKALLRVGSEESEFFQTYLAAGGERQTFARWQDMPPDELFRQISGEKTRIEETVGVINQGFDVVSWISSKSELITRGAEYIKSRKAGNPHVVAMEDAGRVSVPFHHLGKLGGGTVGQTMIKMIPFFNPGIQALAQYSRAIKDGSTRNRALFVTLGVIAATVGSLEYLMERGTETQKDLYKDLEPSELAMYVWLPHPDGKRLLKWRVPEQMSMAGTLINMGLAEIQMGTDYKFQDYVAAGTAFLPDQFNVTDPVRAFMSMIPQMIKPGLMTLLGKKDWPKVREMESMGLKGKEPRFRFHENTSEFSKWLGNKLNLSPIKIDYLIEGYMGRITRFFTGKEISNPFVREWYFTSGRNLQDYYETREDVLQKLKAHKEGSRDFSPKDVGFLYAQKKIIDETEKNLKFLRDLDKLGLDKEKKDSLYGTQSEIVRRHVLDNAETLRRLSPSKER